MLQKPCLLLILVVTPGFCQNVGSFRKENVQFWKRTHGGDFENLFNVYDPSFLSVVWPKLRNGVHLLLELSCWDDVTMFFKALAQGKPWAFDVVDASGRYPSSLFAGTRHWLGSKTRCLEMSDDFKLNGHNATLMALRNNDYVSAILRREKSYDADDDEWNWVLHDETMQALVAEEHRPPFPLAYTTLRLHLNITKFVMYKSYDITLGVCLPLSCSSDDVETIVNFSLTLSAGLRSNSSVPRSARVYSARQVDAGYSLMTDTGAVVLLSIMLLLLALAIVATAVDLNILKCFPYNKKSMSFDLPQYKNPAETKLVDELKRKHTRVMNVDSFLDTVAMNSIGTKKVSMPAAGAVGPEPAAERAVGSCTRCGKYRRQCPAGRQATSLAAPPVPPSCPRLKYTSFASLSTEDRRNKFLCKLLLCFSLRQSMSRIFNRQMANRDLALIQAIKIVATFWVMFVHVALIVSYTSNSAEDLNKREDVYYIIATGTLAFHTLFFVSGVISSYHFFYLKSRYSVKELVNFSGTCGQVMQFVCFVTNRIIRLVPSYGVAAMCAGAAARWAAARAALPLPDADHVACDHYWWRNLLYITNLYPQDERCLQISWFLTTETQLHALGALACAVSVSGDRSGDMSGGMSADVSAGERAARAAARLRARLVAAVALAFALAAVAADLSEAFVQGDLLYSGAYAMYGSVVERGWASVAPYCAGAVTGRLLVAAGGRGPAGAGVGGLAWAVSALLLATGATATRWAGGAAWGGAAWAAGLVWPALEAARRRGVAARGAGLARLCYGVLLSHATVARLLLPDHAMYSDMVSICSYFLATSVCSILAALVLAVLVEMPCCSLLRRLSDSAV